MVIENFQCFLGIVAHIISVMIAVQFNVFDSCVCKSFYGLLEWFDSESPVAPRKVQLSFKSLRVVSFDLLETVSNILVDDFVIL